MNKLVGAVPDGYALISIDALKAWGKYDEVRNACQFSAEQAEQEPLMITPGGGAFPFAVVGELEQPVSQEPVGEVFQEEYGLDVALKLPLPPAGTKLYTAPVRTKDLTDAHILVLWQETANPDAHRIERFARAVIAADREKNRG